MTRFMRIIRAFNHAEQTRMLLRSRGSVTIVIASGRLSSTRSSSSVLNLP